jgi:hypothetical protein
MATGRRRLSLSRCTAWGLVIGGHALLVVLFSSARPVRMTEPDETLQTVLFLPELTPEPASAPVSGAGRERRAPTRRRAYSETVTADSSAITQVPGEAPIDWQLEAQRSAQAIGADLARGEPKCDDSGRPWSLQPKCRKPKHPPAWEPETPRAGFDHLIPYVRLGKRCILGLGFFGCALGKLPEANGHLFDDMKDPDRDRDLP